MDSPPTPSSPDGSTYETGISKLKAAVEAVGPTVHIEAISADDARTNLLDGDTVRFRIEFVPAPRWLLVGAAYSMRNFTGRRWAQSASVDATYSRPSPESPNGVLKLEIDARGLAVPTALAVVEGLCNLVPESTQVHIQPTSKAEALSPFRTQPFAWMKTAERELAGDAAQLAASMSDSPFAYDLAWTRSIKVGQGRAIAIAVERGLHNEPFVATFEATFKAPFATLVCATYALNQDGTSKVVVPQRTSSD